MTISSSRWMAALADQTPMTAVAIPGTHDACCHELTGVAQQLWNSKWAPLLVTAAALPMAGLLGLTAADYVVRVLAQTQTLDIRQQLAAGVRFFDLRPSFGEGGTLPIYHGIIRTRITLNDVLREIDSFLNRQPSEYVVLRLKAENDSVAYSSRTALLQQCLSPYGSRMLTSQGWGAVPVGAVRGKMVLLLQDIDALPSPFHSRDWSTASIQDEYEINADENFISTLAEGACKAGTAPIKAILGLFGKQTGNWCENVGKNVPKIFIPDKVFESKRLAIRSQHDRAVARSGSSLSRFSINFVSCVGAGSDILSLSPQVCADKFNPGIKDLLAKDANGDKAGIVVMDFITEDLARSIYLSNRLST